MRGVIGMLFVLLGLVMGYLILSGKFPSATPLVSSATPAVAGTPTQSAVTPSGGPTPTGGPAVPGTGSGPTGLPTMLYFHDIVASRGGLQ